MRNFNISLFIIAVLFSGCSLLDTDSGGQEPVIKEDLPRPLTAQEKKLINAGNAFSYEIFRKIAAVEENENIIISPLSISMALGMTLNGASGETLTAMKETVGMSAMKLKQINQSYQSLIELLVNLDPKVKMMIANSVWSHKIFPVIPDFTERLQKYFSAQAQTLDFSEPKTPDIINNWVSEHTGGNIKKIVPDNIPPEIVMYLINAVYFKGSWLNKFDPQKTQAQPFHLSDGSTVRVSMMQQEAEINYFRSDEVVMAELPYGNSLYRMTMLMPADPDVSLEKFTSQKLSASVMQTWLEKLTKHEATIKMPKFEFSYKKELNNILKAMGMAIAFNKYKADFSNLSPDPRAYISTVKHKAAITVYEEGTEASAATSVGIGLTSAPAPIVFNRPFIFMIRENVSGTILFMGQVYNPSKK